MRKHIFIIVAALLMIMLPVPVAADDYDYFTMSFYTDPSSLPSQGGTVQLTIKIDHASNSAYVMSNAAVYKNGDKILSLGNIYAGQSISKTAAMSVRSSESDSVTLTLKWMENNTTPQEKDFTVSFDQAADIEPEVQFTRQLSHTSGDSGSTVLLTYRVENTGSVSIEDLVISDSAVGNVKSLNLLKAGQYTSASTTRKIESGFTSSPKITYTSGGKSYEATVASVEVTSGQPEIQLTVESNKDVVAPNEPFQISCTITNTGTAALTSIYVSEKDLGDIFTAAGLGAGESKVFTKDLTLDETSTLQFMAAGDNGGEQEWTDNAELLVTVDAAKAPLNAKIDAIASAIQLVYPGVVNFDITVTNTGTDMLKNLQVLDKEGAVIEEISQLVTGRSTFQWSTEVNESTIYTFTLSVDDGQGNVRTITSSPIEVKVLNPSTSDDETAVTPVPTPDSTPLPTSTPPKNKTLNSIATTMAFIVIGVLIVAIILASIVNRIRSRRKR